MALNRTISTSMRRLLAPRPAILAWRNARSLTIEANNETAIRPPPLSTSPSQPPPTSLDSTQSIPRDVSEEGADFSSIGSSEGVTAQDIAQAEETKLAGVEKLPLRPVGVVVSSGKMGKTVRVRIASQKWHVYLRKHFPNSTQHLVHDPNDSLRTGDVISIRPYRAARTVHHIVDHVVNPFGPPLSRRPPIPTEEEMAAAYEISRAAKLKRRELKIAAAGGSEEAVAQLKAMGIGEGEGTGKDVKGKKGKKKVKGVVGKKGQKLAAGVLPGGLHAVGKIDERAGKNKKKAVKREEKAEGNIAEARRME